MSTPGSNSTILSYFLGSKLHFHLQLDYPRYPCHSSSQVASNFTLTIRIIPLSFSPFPTSLNSHLPLTAGYDIMEMIIISRLRLALLTESKWQEWLLCRILIHWQFRRCSSAAIAKVNHHNVWTHIHTCVANGKRFSSSLCSRPANHTATSEAYKLGLPATNSFSARETSAPVTQWSYLWSYR